MPLLDENSPRIPQPECITIQLKPHQRAMVYQMLESEKKNFNERTLQYIRSCSANFSILCDRVGSGKSLMIVTLLSLKVKTIPNKQLEDIRSIPFKVMYGESARIKSINNVSSVEGIEDKDNIYKVNCNLLIVPFGIFSQWVDFFKHSSNLKILKINKSKNIKEIIDIAKKRTW